MTIRASRTTKLRVALAAAAVAAAGLPTLALAPAAAAAVTGQVVSFGSNPGNLQMFRYVPDDLPRNAPVVVAMHGCTQRATAYDDEPGWTALADRWKFILVLPQQTSANNANSCFNWFESADITRGSGEALSIKQMVDKTKADYSVDAGRVYATGLSAGGAMTAVMVATYPDVFAGGAVVAGLPYRCATSLYAAFGCMSPGVDKTARAWGDLVRGASGHRGPWPRMSLWHGDADATVKPGNLTELVQQWTDVYGVDATADVSDSVNGYPHRVFTDAAGSPVVETYSIPGMGHGTPVDPGTATEQCGTAAAYVLDVGICSSYAIGRFFGLDRTAGGGTGDTTAPSTSVTAPAAGSTVSGSVSVEASASDAGGISRVDFLVDGAVLASDSTAPYAADWNTTSAANGTHTLVAEAYDAAGNVGPSAGVPVTVSNATSGGGLTETFSDRDGSGDLLDVPGWTAGGWTASTSDATGLTGSRSAYGYASSGWGCLGGTRTRTLSRSVTLGGAPTLSYARQLDLSAAVNRSTTAGFRVRVAGTVVDSKSVTSASYRDAGWVSRTDIDLSPWAGRTVTLAFESSAYSNVCLPVHAKNLVDDVRVSG
ncbi:MAG: PHB depolymerase family esterase [Actinomycetota bacterium]|nr:PHB depolymerase family esterase [Actinomycetota bacterium]